MKRISRANEAYFTREWGVFHARMKRISRVNEAYFTREWGVFHAWMRRISRVNEAYFTREWSVFHAWMKRVNSKCSSVQLRTIYSRHSRLVWTHLYTIKNKSATSFLFLNVSIKNIWRSFVAKEGYKKIIKRWNASLWHRLKQLYF